MSQLQELANLAQQYQFAYQNGQISGADYKEIINDLGVAQHIQQTADELSEDIMYRQILMVAFQVASAIV